MICDAGRGRKASTRRRRNGRERGRGGGVCRFGLTRERGGPSFFFCRILFSVFFLLPVLFSFYFVVLFWSVFFLPVCFFFAVFIRFLFFRCFFFARFDFFLLGSFFAFFIRSFISSNLLYVAVVGPNPIVAATSIRLHMRFLLQLIVSPCVFSFN